MRADASEACRLLLAPALSQLRCRSRFTPSFPALPLHRPPRYPDACWCPILLLSVAVFHESSIINRLGKDHGCAADDGGRPMSIRWRMSDCLMCTVHRIFRGGCTLARLGSRPCGALSPGLMGCAMRYIIPRAHELRPWPGMRGDKNRCSTISTQDTHLLHLDTCSTRIHSKRTSIAIPLQDVQLPHVHTCRITIRSNQSHIYRHPAGGCAALTFACFPHHDATST